MALFALLLISATFSALFGFIFVFLCKQSALAGLAILATALSSLFAYRTLKHLEN